MLTSFSPFPPLGGSGPLPLALPANIGVACLTTNRRLERKVRSTVPALEEILVMDQEEQDLLQGRPSWAVVDMGPRARMAFEDFLALGPTRTVRQLSQFYIGQSDLGEPVPTISANQVRNWINQFDWFTLARQWDMEMAEAQRRVIKQAAEIVRRRHAYIGMLMQKVGVAQLQKIVEADDRLEPGEARRWIETGIKLEREAKGVDIVEQGRAMEPSDLSTVAGEELVIEIRETLIGLRRAGVLQAD